MARIDSLNVLLDPSGKMLLAEAYDGVIANVQKSAISVRLKNTDLSGDPTAGTVEAKRFANATSKAYGTARTAGKGDAAKGKPVVIPIDKNKEFVEEIEEKDISLLGVDGLIAKRAANHAARMSAELDEAFFAEGKTSGTKYTPATGVTAIADKIEGAIVTLETLKNSYIDGIDRSMMALVLDPQTYSAMRTYLDTTVHNANIDTAAEQFITYHGVRVYSSNRLPSYTEGESTSAKNYKVRFELMMEGSIAQPVMSDSYSAERVPLSQAMAVELFFYYGTKAVTPETILYYAEEVTA